MSPIDGDNAEQLEQVLEIIRSARYMIVTSIDKEQRLIVIRKGIPEDELPDAMRYFANALEELQKEERAAQVAQAAASVFESTPAHLKAHCPGCDAPVILVTPLPPPEILKRPNVNARCVCTCGSFLVPYYEGDALALRLMSVEEIAATPDEIRNHMLSLRRRMAAEHARRMQAN